MNPNQVAAVRDSFAQLLPQADAVARLFYARLFDLDPQLRQLFKSDMRAQRGMLMSMLAAGVNGLGNIDALRPVLQDLGARHVDYGVRYAHYDTVGAALLDTLGRTPPQAPLPAFRWRTRIR
jgi:hemoglobin-like flavoprotein